MNWRVNWDNMITLIDEVHPEDKNNIKGDKEKKNIKRREIKKITEKKKASFQTKLIK